MIRRILRYLISKNHSLTKEILNEEFKKDRIFKDDVFTNLLEGKEVMSLRVNELNDFRDGDVINLPDNVVFYQSIINNCYVNAKEIKLGSRCVMSNNVTKFQ